MNWMEEIQWRRQPGFSGTCFAAKVLRAQRNVVVANAAFAIQTVEQDKPIEECLEIAGESLYGKKALKTLEKFVELNKG